MMRTLVLVTVLALAIPALVDAQPEDRRRAPTAATPTAATDPCAEGGIADRMRGPSPTWPGFDPRAPMPAGATSFTGVAPPGRDPSRGFPQPPQPDQAYQSCPPRLSR